MIKIKKLFTLAIAVLMAVVCTVSFTGCTKIKKMQLTLSVYDYDNHKFVEQTMDIDLYAHLAPKTVEAIMSYVKGGYYDNAVLYKMGGYASQIMVGDYDYDGQTLSQKEQKPTITGEFTYGGVKYEGGSPLKAKNGSIGLWRSWYEQDGSHRGRSATNSGSATMFMPTQDLSEYDGYFCIFAQIDLEDSKTEKAFKAIKAVFDAEDASDIYTVYYTGEYDSTATLNHGLTFNYMDAENFDADDIEGLFEAEDNQLVCYNYHNVTIPVAQGQPAVKIVSAKIK